MDARYFLMLDDVHVPGRWFLVNPVDRQGRDIGFLLMDGKPLQIEGPIRVGFSKYAARGHPVDYCEINVARVPLVHARVAGVLVELAPSDVQCFPVEIEGHPDQFFLVNITQVRRCIDEKASEHVEVLTTEDEEFFPGHVGEYRDVTGMRIDPTKVGNARIFRPWGWSVAIIVSEEIKEALERIGTVGVKFQEV